MMGIRELREIYGPKSKTPAAVARAVRAEIPGAARLYDLKNALYRAKSTAPELEPYFNEVSAVLAEMRRSIAEKYQLKGTLENEEI